MYSNLSFSTSEETVRSLFESHGTVDRVNIARDRATAKRFCFVDMMNDGEADQAMSALNGRNIDGRKLNEDSTVEKSHRQ